MNQSLDVQKYVHDIYYRLIQNVTNIHKLIDIVIENTSYKMDAHNFPICDQVAAVFSLKNDDQLPYLQNTW